MKTYKIKVNGSSFEVAVEKTSADQAQVKVNGVAYNVEVDQNYKKVDQSKLQPLTAAAPSAPVVRAAAPVSAGAGSDLKAPLPGTILEIYVSEGASVKTGDKLMMLEAMKMENNIEAECDGVVKKVHVTKGANVLEGDVLVTIG